MEVLNLLELKGLTSASGLEERISRGDVLLQDFLSSLILNKFSSCTSSVSYELSCVFFQGPLNVDVAPGAPQEKNGIHRKSDVAEMREPQQR